MGTGTDIKNRHVPDGRLMRTGVRLLKRTINAGTAAQLRAIPATNRGDGQLAHVVADRSNWVFDGDSAAVDTTNNLVMAPDAGTGAWLRTDMVVPMKFAADFGTADAATLFTVPAGFNLQLQATFWEVTADYTGGTSSAIGISSADAPHSTQGDLLGGTVGSVLAELTAAISINAVPRGLSFTAAPFVPVLKATNTIRFDRITSAFTAGTGFVHVIAHQIQIG